MWGNVAMSMMTALLDILCCVVGMQWQFEYSVVVLVFGSHMCLDVGRDQHLVMCPALGVAVWVMGCAIWYTLSAMQNGSICTVKLVGYSSYCKCHLDTYGAKKTKKRI